MAEPAIPPFVLASGSAGRLRVLQQAGIDPEVVVSSVDETVEDGLETATAVGVSRCPCCDGCWPISELR